MGQPPLGQQPVPGQPPQWQQQPGQRFPGQQHQWQQQPGQPQWQPIPGGAPWPPQGQPPKKRRTGLIVTLSVVGVVVLVAAGIVTAGLIKRAGMHDPAPTNQSGPPPNGQSDVLKQLGPQGQPVNYAGGAMFDACALMPSSLLTGVGLKLNTTVYTTHSYVERSVPAGQAATGVMFSTYPSDCEYQLLSDPKLDQYNDHGDSHVDLAVSQAPFNSPDDPVDSIKEYLDREAAGKQLTATAGGLSWYVDSQLTSKPGDFAAGILVPGHYDLYLQLFIGGLVNPYNGKSPNDIGAAVVNAIAQNVAKGPTGPMGVSYQVDKIPGVQPACKVFDASTYQNFTTVADSGSVTETNTTNETVLVSNIDGSVGYYVQSDCKRDSAADLKNAGHPQNRYEVKFDTFRDPDEGKEGFYECNPQIVSTVGKLTPVNTRIGDDQTCVLTLPPSYGYNSYTLSFRVGRTVVSIEVSTQGQLDPAQWAQQVAPLAQALAGKLH